MTVRFDARTRAPVSPHFASRQRRPRSGPAVLAAELLEDRICLSGFAGRLIPPPVTGINHTPAEPVDVIPPSAPRPGSPAPPAEGEILDLGGGLIAFLTSERAQGRDLNRDGDKLDQVLQSFNANTGIVRNSGQAALPDSLVDLGGGLVAFLTSEAAQKRALNRDGDKLDNVLQVFNAATGVVRNSQQQAVLGSILDLEIGGVAFLTSEAAQKQVLNGDGDKLDEVLQSFDPVANIVRNSRQQAVADSVIDLENGTVAFLTDESAQGQDLNGDEDKLDSVLQVFDTVLGTVQNTGQAV
jgi:hypothetical protein